MATRKIHQREKPNADAASLIHTWLSQYNQENTRKAYEADFAQLAIFTGYVGDMMNGILQITPSEVIAWIDHLKECKTSEASIARKLSCVRSFLIMS